MEWYLKVLRAYADFTGRARRQEYWTFFWINLLIAIGLTLIDGFLGSFGNEIGLFSGLYALAVLLPSLAVAVRRLHDTGRSAWWLLWLLLPVLGPLLLLLLLAIDGQRGDNRYGPDPKAGLPGRLVA